jgi:hypothetical protein
VQIADFQHDDFRCPFNTMTKNSRTQPTLPSSFNSISFCASTANSIGSFLEHFLTKAVDDEADTHPPRFNAALLAVENLILADLGGAGFMLDLSAGILHIDIGEGVRAALIAHQQRIALRVIAGVLGGRQDFTSPR